MGLTNPEKTWEGSPWEAECIRGWFPVLEGALNVPDDILARKDLRSILVEKVETGGWDLRLVFFKFTDGVE